jgi:hypothetical protein
MIQEGGRKSSKKTSRKASRKASRKSSRRSVKSKSSRKSSRKASRKASRRSVSKKSKKARRDANPQITVRGALVKYVWKDKDFVNKVAAQKGMKPIGIPAKIVQMVMVQAQKEHPISEANKKNAAEWSAVQKIAMKLLEGGLQKYADQIKKA